MEFTKDNEILLSAVIKVKNKYFCRRCGNNDQSEFFQDELGIYCRKCLIFGKSATYSKIWQKRVITEFNKKYILKKDIFLSELQEIASKKCVDAYKNKRDILIFAVCGAGKTELVYEVILKVLNEGKIACFSTPRKDVVIELLPRFKRDFQDVSIIGLYEGSTDKGKIGNLYVSTTHQLINFYHFFDLIIIDEVDAYPYYNNKMLEGFIKKAKKQDAPIIYLTATPPKHFFYLMKKKIIDYYIIPVRYHKYPIPVPRVVLTYNTKVQINKGKCPKQIYQWLKKRDKRVFIFVPTIDLGKKLEKILKDKFNCKFVYAEMKERKKIIADFRNNKFQYIITTTILERGVTVSNVDVCIINCDDKIFDEKAIVQIVGRAGRDKLYPFSNVVLFADFYTVGIKKAIRHIKKMNLLRKKL